MVGNLGDDGMDIGNGSGMWSGAGMVGDGEARNRAPEGLGWNKSDMVGWIFSSPSTSLYTTL